ncbi:MAG: caspase family protein [Pseudomonadota bacterium]
MDFNRMKILLVSLPLFMLCFWFFPLSILADSRAITVIGNLSHQSGKLGAYRALIIGINDYQDAKIPALKTAVNDAKAMSELLGKRYGFKVKLLLNQEATKKTIYQALRDLASSTQPDDSVLIYYAGHGDLDRTFNDGWWIPVDAKSGDSVTYLDNTQVQKAMSSMQARHVLLISDSCYSGTLFGDARAMPPVIDDKYYLDLYNEKSRWGMTSGNRTPVSDKGSGGHSVFAYQVLKELRQNEKPYISTQEIYTRIAPIVGNNSEQTPLCRPIRNTGDQGGEFVFVASSGAGRVVPGPVKTDDTGLSAERERLEQERNELEKIKAEAAERKRIEEERLRIEAEKKQILAIARPDTPSSPSSSEEKEIKRDGTLIVAYASGVVFDKHTGLEWFAGPDRDTTLNDAKAWVESLNVAGGGWRMPTKEELKTLYKMGAGTRNMTPLLKTTGWYVWGKIEGSSVFWPFTFTTGDDAWGIRDSSYDKRGFAVRSRR